MAPGPRDLLGTYQDTLRELRKYAGPVGPLLRPLEVQAELIDAALERQAELEQVVAGVVEPLGALVELARDAPATLRTQAKAFEAASVSFKQAADVMNLQADLLERTAAALSAPAELLRGLRPGPGPAER
jgi:hypothetical protein